MASTTVVAPVAPTTDNDGVIDLPDEEIGRVLSLAESRALFDDQARHYLGMSGKEFIERWRRGDYDADPDIPGVIDMLMLLPAAHADAPW